MKKPLQDCLAIFLENAALHFQLMVQRQRVHVYDGTQGAPLLIVTPEDNAPDPRFNDGAGAHDAGLHRNIEGAVSEPVIVQHVGRHVDGEHLGVGGWSVGTDRQVVRPRYDLFLRRHDNSADRNFILGECPLRLSQAHRHEMQIIHANNIPVICDKINWNNLLREG